MKNRLCAKILFFLALTLLFSIWAKTGIDQEEYKRYEDLPGVIKLKDPPKEFGPEITFLSKVPKIDGLLDTNLQELPVRGFNFVMQDRTEKKLPIQVTSYRLAYGTDFFYVYIEAEGDQLHFRDRAYQNGDGFHMLLALPKPNDERTDEFYVLACSAVNNPRMAWTRRIFWYYNVDTIFMRTSPNTKLEFQASKGKISFELYLPWRAVYPYHPWISDGIGFNLCLAKAIGDRARNRYIVYPDRYLSAENRKRAYYRLKFQKPVLEEKQQTYLILEKNHINEGNSLKAKAVSLSSKPTEEQIIADIKTSEGKIVGNYSSQYACEKGITEKQFAIDSKNIIAGDYNVEWFSRQNDLKGQIGFTILPDFDGMAYKQDLDSVRKKISQGSYSSLLFELQELEQQLDSLKSYETCSPLINRISRLQESLGKAKRGEDSYANMTELFRRAFRSKIDNTLQPYSIKVPHNFDHSIKYPLLVFLHGSASDETDMYGFQYLIPSNFIAIGPRARGPSHYYVRDHALEDIAEAMDSVIANYPIDADNIFLSGFSMGGYGVYRTFYEMPDRFKGLIVLSGRPDLPTYVTSDEKQPDFLLDEYLEPFKDVQIFIYHGKKDLNVPINKTEMLVEKMKAFGVNVEFHVEDDKGHERPGSKTIAAYRKWIAKILEKDN